MRILVTGGAGFIGSHLCDRLIEDGHIVFVLDDFSTGVPLNLTQLADNPSFVLVKGSVLDFDKLCHLVRDVDYVFHLAAAVGVFNIVNKPLASLLTNIRGTENVLESASLFNTPVLLTSSSEVYGKNVSDSLKESDEIDESLAYAYYKEKGLETRIVRFFNTVGPRQLGSHGMVLPRFISAALNDEPIEIYGDGNQTRCFAHVYDVVEALMAIAFSDMTIAKVINIGNNTEISIASLAQRVISVIGSKSKVVHVPYSQAYGDGFEDMERRVPNIDLIFELVGWKPMRNLSVIISDIASDMRRE